jgi:predicted ATPase
VFVGGEPGIGKTRLVSELADYAEARQSALVLWSTCWEGEGAPAFWPWVQLIRGYSGHVDVSTLRQDFGGGAADIAQLILDLAAACATEVRVAGSEPPR